MQKNVLIPLTLALLIIGGYFIVTGLRTTSTDSMQQADSDSITGIIATGNSSNTNTNSDANADTNALPNTNVNDDTVADQASEDLVDGPDTYTNPNKNTNSNSQTSTGAIYETYAPDKINQPGKKVVLFFHANWCPTCKTANTAIIQRINELPNNLVILKTDYDTETELKSKYGITYQHTFVQVDAQGNEITKWNGGDVDLLLSNVK